MFLHLQPSYYFAVKHEVVCNRLFIIKQVKIKINDGVVTCQGRHRWGVSL